jgi:hypothetical protein
VVFGQIGVGLGNYRFSLWEKALGLGQPTGIELPESTGSTANIYPGVDAQVAAAAAGQTEARATNAQLCTLIATVLRGGDRPAGHVLLEIRDFTSGEAIYHKPSESLSLRPIGANHVAHILQSLKTNATLMGAISDEVASARSVGMELGLLSARSPATGASLALAFAAPREGVDSVTDRTVALSAVLEGAMTQDDATRIAAATLADYYTTLTP